MARLTVSLPDELLTKLDRLAKRQHRSRSELLREAARRYLSQPQEPSQSETPPTPLQASHENRRWTREELEQYLLDKGVIRRGCPELEALLGNSANLFRTVLGKGTGSQSLLQLLTIVLSRRIQPH